MLSQSSSSLLRRNIAPPILAGLLLLAGLGGATAHAQLPDSSARLDARAPIPYFVAEGEPETGYRHSDRELATWALEAWQRAANGALIFSLTSQRDAAIVRIEWAPAAGGRYGEMQPIAVDGRRGATVYIRPDVASLGSEIAARALADPLYRETIVYLTCLHELGHALGLEHTAEYDDVMYFFGFGGDIAEYFARYRRELERRDDIRTRTGLSRGDFAQLEARY